MEDTEVDQADGYAHHHETNLIEDSGYEGEDEEGFSVVWTLEFDVVASAVVTEEAVDDGDTDGEDLDEVLGEDFELGDLGRVIDIPMIQKCKRRPNPSFS